jgi:hypothetical protein
MMSLEPKHFFVFPRGVPMSKKSESMSVACESCGKPIKITKRTSVGKATCMDSEPPRQEIIIDRCPHCKSRGGAVVPVDAAQPLLMWLWEHGKPAVK